MTPTLLALALLPWTDTKVLTRQAAAVLQTHCARCHGQEGSVEGGFNFVTDLPRLVARRKVVPGKPEQSRLLARIVNEQMPPPGEEPRPSPAEIDTLRRWIAAGAPATPAAVTTVATADVNRWLLDDLNHFDRRARRFQRYVSLVPLANAGLSASELATYRHATAKLLNSLSWHPKLLTPTPVGPGGLLLRFDLRDSMWDNTLWNRLLVDYPYGVQEESALARAVMVQTASRQPAVRADWFLAAASRPPLYYDLLQLPGNQSELERLLRVDPVLNIQQERVARAGFNGSGVSRNNRLIERHDALHGAYWRTYDFDAVPQSLAERGGLAPDRRNLFAYPLGPGGGDSTFTHAGGEAIFHLPNGLLGFYLANAAGSRIDKAPTAIVSDPRRPDRAVEPCISCLSCHLTGIIPKSDQVRDHLAHNPGAFSRADADLIRALYAPDAKLKPLMESDGAKFRTAVAALGGRPGKTEPVSTLALRYEADVDLTTAAAEVGLAPAAFRTAVEKSELLTKALGPLRSAGGTVSRPAFVQAFADAVNELRLGVPLANVAATGLADNTGDLDPLEGQPGVVTAAVVMPDGRRVLVSGADRSVRLIDAETGRETRRFLGHTASVWAVAVSPDGKLAASAGADGTVRLWDIDAGIETRKIDAHLGFVAALAFSGDGKQLVSAGIDQTIALWEVASGRELKREEPGSALIAAVGLTKRGPIFLAALSRATVGTLAVSADGERFAAGDDAGLVRLGRAGGGFAWQTPAHDGPVRAVAWSPDGRWLASAGADGTVRLRVAADGRELGVFRQHAGPVVGVGFTLDGRNTVSVGRDGRVRYWSLAKFVPATEAPAAPTDKPLSPLTTLPLDGTAGPLALTPNGKWLFALNRADGSLLQIDAAELQVKRTLSLNAETYALSPDGTALYALAAKELLTIDPKEFRVTARVPLPGAGYDLAPANGGRVHVALASSGWSDVLTVAAGQIVQRTGGVWGRSFVRQAAGSNRLYLFAPGSTQVQIQSAEPGGDSAGVRGHTAPGVSGDIVLSPDGRFLLSRGGAVLKLSREHADDVTAFAKVDPFAAVAFDASGGRLWVATPGGWLKQYSYPDFQLAWSRKLPGAAYQAAFAAGRLYLAVIDPDALRDRVRARGFTDVQVYDLP